MARSRGKLMENRPARYKVAPTPPDAVPVGQSMYDHVMQAAARSSLLGGKSTRISGRVSPALVSQAKRMTGIDSDTKLIEFALATIALEDPFPKAFAESHGKVDPRLKLDFFEY